MDSSELTHQYKNLLSSNIYELNFALLTVIWMETSVKSKHFNVFLSVITNTPFLFRFFEADKSMNKGQHVYSFQ